MNELSIPKIFVENGNSSRKFENFQNFTFKDLDFKGSADPISFYRSDFRGATITKVYFWKNSFERCDFINSYISDSTFEECHFRTDFTNIIFERVFFNSNFEDTCAFYNCMFLNCTFQHERVTETVTRNCEYNECIINGCSFDKNAFDDITFFKTTLQDISLADMGAINLSFDQCTFENVVLDPDYLGSYLVKNTSMANIRYEYRGHEIPLSGELIEDFRTLSLFFMQERRYNEAFNLTILYNFHSKSNASLSVFFKQIVEAVNTDFHILRHVEQLTRYVAIIKFYGVSAMINAKDLFYMIGLLKSTDTSSVRIRDRVAFEHSIYDLENTFQTVLLQPWMWDSIDPFALVMAEVKIDESDLDLFKENYLAYLDQLLKDLRQPSIHPEFQIIGVRKGSLVIEFISYAIAVYGLARIIKAIFSEIYSIRLEFEIHKKTIRLISESDVKSPLLLKKNIVAARKIINEPSDDLLKNSNKLSVLLKRFKIYTNTF
ncbi:MAG: hypothetical protein JSU01_05170 [Bacteroidetes bacterium]|nr:hypothetical protein [Bacteroidota bacterium]